MGTFAKASFPGVASQRWELSGVLGGSLRRQPAQLHLQGLTLLVFPREWGDRLSRRISVEAVLGGGVTANEKCGGETVPEMATGGDDSPYLGRGSLG